MTSKRRKLLFFLFILLFAFLAPLVIFYASGYRINWTWPPNLGQTFQKTGMLVLETEPEGAEIYIDGKLKKNLLNNIIPSADKDKIVKTPAKLKYMAPGKYHVLLKKDGYWPWEKEVEIMPGKQTKIEDIILFKKGLPLKIVSASAGEMIFSPDKRRVLLPQDGLMVDLDKEEVQSIPRIPLKEQATTTVSQEITWSPNGEKFLIGAKIYNIDNIKSPINLEDLEDEGIKNIKWRDNSSICYQLQNSIKLFDIDSGAKQTLVSPDKDVINYFPENDKLYTIANQGVKTSLEIYSITSRDMVKRIELPYSTGYTFINPGHKTINLYDKNYNILYLINESSFFNPVETVLENVEYSDWIGEDNLVYANKFEIWTYNTSTGNKNLLTRISKPLIGVNWHPTGSYVLYYTETSLNVIETGKRRRRDVTKLMNVNKIYSPAISADGDVIYFNAEIGRSAGLYKLNL
jgi:hypothetical protein